MNSLLTSFDRRGYVDQLETMSPFIIFSYWEEPNCKKGTVTFYPSQELCIKKSYLSLCKRTLLYTNASDFLILYLDQFTIKDYLTEEDLAPFHFDELDELFPTIPQKTDFFRLLLLQKYGGIWCDADIIFFKSLKPYANLLKEVDFVGFGCYYEDCQIRKNGFGYPANWVLISCRNGILVSKAVAAIKEMLRKNRKIATLSYHCFGKDLLKEQLQILINEKGYTYHHVPSSCVERDERGRKWTNQRMLSEENLTTVCVDRFIFIPIYNSAPGFPESFLKLTSQEILSANFLISKLFRKALDL